MAISTIAMAAIMRMHSPGLALAKHVMGIRAKARRVALGLTARQHSVSPKAASARMISRTFARLRTSSTISKVTSLLVMTR